jgi:hypothetical protein
MYWKVIRLSASERYAEKRAVRTAGAASDDRRPTS